MKKFMVCLMLLCSGSFCYSQAQLSPEQEIAGRIAQKMKDSLSLNNHLRDQIYNINLQLHNQKATVRQQYAVQDSVRIHVQRIENTRDSLYKGVLSSEKFLLYKLKKRNLVSMN